MEVQQHEIASQTDAREAARQARQQFLMQQALQIFTTIRLLKTTILLATAAGEISDEAKQSIYDEAIAIAGMCEVRR